MSINYRYDKEKRALYGVLSGTLSIEDFSSALEEVVSSEEHPPNIRSIWDLRDLDFSGITRDFENALIDVRAAYPERRGVRLAIVVESDLGFGMSRMYEFLGDNLGDQTAVFRDYPEAESWLLEE